MCPPTPAGSHDHDEVQRFASALRTDQAAPERRTSWPSSATDRAALSATPLGATEEGGTEEGEVLRVVAGERGSVWCRSEAGPLVAVDVEPVAPVRAGDLLLVHGGVAQVRLRRLGAGSVARAEAERGGLRELRHLFGIHVPGIR